MKKITAVVLPLALVLMLAGCNGQSASSEDTSPAEVVKTYATNIVIEASADIKSTVNGLTDGLCSWTQGGQDATTVAGDDYAFSPVIYIADGAFVSDKSNTDEEISSETLSDTSITINKEAVNGVVVKDSNYTIENSAIEVNADEADGSTTCDFSGLGSALAVYGSSNVTVKDTVLKASGVADMGLFVDNGATVLLDGVTMSSEGGTLYSGYVNSPAQETMVAPPWILGIMGNSRSSNLMGTNSTLSVVDSEASASNWAVLSTDSGSNMALNVVNSTLSLTGSDKELQADGKFSIENPYTTRSGYGTYVIGNSEQNFLGATMNVGTYAAIFTGGSATYGNLVKGETYNLQASDGSTQTTYTASDDVQTVINSDTFGFMAHQNTNYCTLDGVQVNSAFTDFLVKSGCDTTITVQNGAELNAANGILLQLLDNDDSTTEYDSSSQAFGETHEEYAGFPTEAVADSSTAADHMQPSDVSDGGNGQGGQGQDTGSAGGAGGGSAPSDMGGTAPGGSGDMGGGSEPGGSGDNGGQGESQGGSSSGSNITIYNVINTDLEGAIYNAIGWNANALSSGNVKQMQLQVNLSGTSTLKGAIASTSCIHTSYDGQTYLKDKGITAFDDDSEAAAFADSYQLTSFSQAEYFNIGQVANLVKSNGINNIDVTLSDSAVWTVSDTSLVSSVALSGNAQVIVEKGVTLTVNGKVYSEGTYTASDF